MENIQNLAIIVGIYNLEFFGCEQQNTKKLESTLTSPRRRAGGYQWLVELMRGYWTALTSLASKLRENSDDHSNYNRFLLGPVPASGWWAEWGFCFLAPTVYLVEKGWFCRRKLWCCYKHWAVKKQRVKALWSERWLENLVGIKCLTLRKEWGSCSPINNGNSTIQWLSSAIPWSENSADILIICAFKIQIYIL